jgi:hypothetical protein
MSHKNKVLGSGLTSIAPTWETIWWVDSSSQYGFARSYDTLFRDGTFRHYQLDLVVNGLGGDCVTRIVATNA